MPSANNRRNRRLRKIEAQRIGKNDSCNSQNSLHLAVAVDKTSINQQKSSASRNSDNCSVCNGKKCDEVFMVGYCGCKFGKYCFNVTYVKECPKCPFKIPNDVVPKPQESLSQNVAGGMVEVGEFASLALEDLSKSASNFMTSWSAGKKFKQQDRSRFDSQQPMDQYERDAVIRNMQIAKAVVGTAATVTGYLANGVGSCLWSLGSFLSPVIRGVSKQILSEWDVDKEKAEHMVDGAMEIAKAAVITTGSVARGVQNSTAILASGACSGLAHIYANSHGFQPGELESDVGEIAANVIHTAWNVKAMTTKSKLTKISKIYPEPESKSSLKRFGFIDE